MNFDTTGRMIFMKNDFFIYHMSNFIINTINRRHRKTSFLTNNWDIYVISIDQV